MVSKILTFALMLLLFVLKLSFVIKDLFQITQSTHTSVSRCLDAAVSQEYLHWIHWIYIHKNASEIMLKFLEPEKRIQLILHILTLTKGKCVTENITLNNMRNWALLFFNDIILFYALCYKNLWRICLLGAIQCGLFKNSDFSLGMPIEWA